MANALAIAAVTALLQDRLNNALIDHDLETPGPLDNVEVTVQPPDQVTPPLAAPRLNLFLYRVTPNTGWVNESLPTRDTSGARRSTSVLALDLHYMLSAYGIEDLDAEILLGYGMQVLHETPVLARDAIRTALSPASPVDGAILPQRYQMLAAADLADQIEQVRISPVYADMEETSRLWSSLNTGLRPTALYQATVVLIESRASFRSALPVREPPAFYVRQLRRPRIRRVLSQRQPPDGPFVAGAQITHTDRVALAGSGLRGDETRVLLGEREITPLPEDVTPRRIVIDLPADLRAGIVGAQVIHRIAKEKPSAPGEMPFESSNLAPFLLSPSFAAVDPIAFVGDPAVDVAETPETETPETQATVRGALRLRFAHPVGADQRVELLLNEAAAPAGRAAHAYSFAWQRPQPPPPVPPQLTELEVEVRGLAQAQYFVRARVGGAESRLIFDEDGNYEGPPPLLEVSL